jgi:hypothetical protein
MHTWIAAALTVITVIVLDRKHFYPDSDDHISLIILAVQIGTPFIFFAVWLCRIA